MTDGALLGVGQALVVVPTYNERENLPVIVERLLSLPTPVDVLVVDDNSPDGTGQVADGLAAEHDQVHVLHRDAKRGLGAAYLTGFRWALERGYEFVLEMDADLSHDPTDVPVLIAAARDADCAIGSRYIHGIRIINWPLRRLMLSKCAGIYVRLVTGMPLTDPTGGFKCFRRRALEALELEQVRSNGYSFQVELNHRLWRRGFRLVEVPIVFTDRFQGQSKMSGRIVREALVMVWKLLAQNGFRRRPRVVAPPAAADARAGSSDTEPHMARRKPAPSVRSATRG